MRNLITLKSILLMAATQFAALTGVTAAPEGDTAVDPSTVVEATLMADTTAVQPNSKLTLGVRFKVQHGWHIYWENPGSSGFATTVKWGLPNGLAPTDELIYPAPIAFEAPGPITSFGYEDEVLLFIDVKTDATLPETGEIEVNAKSRWLMCSDRCIPGKKDLSLKLPIGKGSAANREIFDRYRKLAPKTVSAVPEGVAFTREKEGAKTTFNLALTGSGTAPIAGEDKLPQIRKAYFFPLPQEGFVLADPVVPEADGSSTVGGKAIKSHSGPVKMSVSMEAGSADAKDAPRLKGVLVYQELPDSGPSPLNVLELDLN